MIEVLRTILDKAYAISERNLLCVNIAISGLVALAHGGALAITYATPTPEASEIRLLASFSLPIVAVVLITAIAALVIAQLKPRVLALHGIVLTAGSGCLLLWALGVLFNGIPEGRFSWSVGLLSASVFYAVVLLCRFSVTANLRSSWRIHYAPFFALACALPVDVGVFFRVVG
jgi:hypothetical protein